MRPDAGPAFERLESLYGGSGRHYHTARHIAHVLAQFDIAREQMDDPDSVEMALWFHDAIYEPSASDNEERSAELFLELAGDDFPEPFKRKVHDLICVTTHRRLPEARDECFMVDIDLSSFGLPWDEFRRDSANVREEFPALTDTEFYPRQKEFLEALLAREHFCFTEFFRERHEESARENICRTLAMLREDGLVDG